MNRYGYRNTESIAVGAPLPFPEADNKTLQVKPSPKGGIVIDYYLVDEITSMKDYIDFLRAVDSTLDNDRVVVHINSYGGWLDTGLQIYNALMMCNAEVIVKVEGICASAASMIMMAADDVEFSPFCEIMLHAFSGVECGKFHEINARVEFDKVWFDKVIRGVYEDFLTEEEMNQLLDGKDFWFMADEAQERWERIIKSREKLIAESEKIQKGLERVVNDYFNEMEKKESSKSKKSSKNKGESENGEKSKSPKKTTKK